MARNFFKRTGPRNLFQQPYAQSGGNPPVLGTGEIDLRAELDDLFFGYTTGVRHGYFVLIRRFRRDPEGKRLPCTCRLEFTREPDPDCSFCRSEGYLFDEDWLWTYSMYAGEGGQLNKYINLPPGQIRVDYKVFFFRYDTNILYGDKIVEVVLDEEGRITLPFVRESIYAPQTINRFRSDNSRTEYIQLSCREQDAIRLDYPRK